MKRLLAVLWLGLSVLRAEDAPPPMVEIEAQFVRATRGQMQAALDAVQGGLDAAQYQAALAKLREAKAEIFSNLRTVTLSGKAARVEAVRELRYPTEWTPRKGEESSLIPTVFETANIGAELTCEPQVRPGGMVEVKVTASLTKFEGFIDYAQKPDGKKLPLAKALDAPLQQLGIWSPVIARMKLETSISAESGRTFLLGAQPMRLPDEADESLKGNEQLVYLFLTTRVVGD